MKNLILIFYSMVPNDTEELIKSLDSAAYYGTYRSEQSCQSAGAKLAKILSDEEIKVEVLCQSK